MSLLRAGRTACGRIRGIGVAGAAAAVVLAGCLNNPGEDPKPGRLNFPIAMEQLDLGDDGMSDHLLVANANFDLGFNRGTLQSYDLDRLLDCAQDCRFSDGCVIVPPEVGSAAADGLVLDAAECDGLIREEVLIGSFASGLALTPARDRAYLPIRSDSDLTWVDIDSEGQISCGGEPGTRHECTDAFRSADDETAGRSLDLPREPVGLHVAPFANLLDDATGAPADAGPSIVMPHRNGAVSLFMEHPVQDRRVPVLVDVVEGLSSDVQNVRWRETSQLGWLPSSTQPSLGRVGVAADASDPLRSILFDAGRLAVTGVDVGGSNVADTRDVQFDPRGLQRAYVLSRSPQALFVANLDEPSNTLDIDRAIDVCIGPSRLELTTLDGQLVAFVSCFDSGLMYVLDVDRGELLGVVSGLSGPFVMEVDQARQRMYVAEFTSSVIRVLSLAPLVECLQGEVVDECAPATEAVLGIPRAEGGVR